MKTWIRAVCDKCGIARYMIDEEIQAFLEEHIHHGLRLAGEDEQLYEWFENEFELAGDGGGLKKK